MFMPDWRRRGPNPSCSVATGTDRMLAEAWTVAEGVGEGVNLVATWTNGLDNDNAIGSPAVAVFLMEEPAFGEMGVALQLASRLNLMPAAGRFESS